MTEYTGAAKALMSAGQEHETNEKASLINEFTSLAGRAVSDYDSGKTDGALLRSFISGRQSESQVKQLNTGSGNNHYSEEDLNGAWNQALRRLPKSQRELVINATSPDDHNFIEADEYGKPMIINKLEKEVEKVSKEREDVKQQLDAANKKVDDLDKQLQAANKKVDDLDKQLKASGKKQPSGQGNKQQGSTPPPPDQSSSPRPEPQQSPLRTNGIRGLFGGGQR